MSGYIDLCIMDGDHQRVLSILLERVAEQPRAWAWTRLLALAEALRDPRFDTLRDAFPRLGTRRRIPNCFPTRRGGGRPRVHGVRQAAAARDGEQRNRGRRTRHGVRSARARSPGLEYQCGPAP
jgi:hypothetical protein